MLKKHKNGFIEIVNRHGFDPKLFFIEDKEIDRHPGFIITLLDSELNFSVISSHESFMELACKYRKLGPAFPEIDFMPESSWADIDFVFNIFEDWLQDHVREYLEDKVLPDLWKLVDEERELVAGAFEDPGADSSFLPNEKEKLLMAIDELQAMIIKIYEINKEDQILLKRRIQYMRNALNRLNRYDWRSVAIVTVFGISLMLNLEGERSKILFRRFLQVFSGVLYLL